MISSGRLLSVYIQGSPGDLAAIEPLEQRCLLDHRSSAYVDDPDSILATSEELIVDHASSRIVERRMQ